MVVVIADMVYVGHRLEVFTRPEEGSVDMSYDFELSSNKIKRTYKDGLHLPSLGSV